jgi:hypothetical protein
MLEMFNEEAQVIVYGHEVERRKGYSLTLKAFLVSFRNLYVDACEVDATANGRLLASVMAMEGSIGMIATTILYFSKHYGRPKVIYLNRDEALDASYVVVEWLPERVDDDVLQRIRESRGFRTDRKIRFEDVVTEARRFLAEYFRS